MVDGTLKRLLDAEMEAELIIANADKERNSIIEQAKQDIQSAEQQQTEFIAKIQASLLAQEEQRAQQIITTMQRQYSEQAHTLRTAAKLHEQQAIADAVALLTILNTQ